MRMARQAMTLTDAAAARVREILASHGGAAAGVRVGVRKGGCSGMAYTLDVAAEKGPYDEVVEDKGVVVLIEPTALMYLLGTEMDFVVETIKSGFVFSNPNETSRCGCGESFSVAPTL